MVLYHILNYKDQELIARKVGTQSIKEIPVKGIIHFEIKKGKYCIGNLFGNKYEFCFSKIEKGTQCERCFKKNKYNYCAACNGKRCYLGRKICGPHVLYLATFANVLKVGVASVKRFPKRVIEQGADYATKIAFFEDGLKARRYERLLHEEFNITDRIPSKFKEKIAFKKEARKMGEYFLKYTYSQIIDKIPKENRLQINVLNLSNYYEEPEVTKLERLDIEKSSEITGKIIGYKGPFVIIKNQNEVFSANFKKLIAKIISLRS